VQEYEITRDGLSGDLALVHSRILLLDPLYMEGPFCGFVAMRRLKPLVRRVSVIGHGQDVEIFVPYPRDLNICTFEFNLSANGL
jgi:hypothetical protein